MAEEPSLDLVFDWLTPIIPSQFQEVDALNAKATSIFSALTVIVALGATFGIREIGACDVGAIIVGSLGLSLYFILVAVFLRVVRLRDLKGLDDARVIRDLRLSQPPAMAKAEMIDQMCEFIDCNDQVIRSKYGPITWLVRCLPLMLLLVTLFLGLGHANL